MVCKVPLVLGTLIDTLVVVIPWRKGADAPPRHKFVVDRVQDRTGHLGLYRHIVLDEGVDHIRAHLQMLACIVHIVGKVTGLSIPESRLEILLDQVMDSGPLGDELLVLAVFLLHVEGYAYRMIPESVGLHLITCSFCHRIAVDVGIHPSECPTIHLGPEQTIGLHDHFTPPIGKITLQYTFDNAPVLLPNRFRIRSADNDVLFQHSGQPHRRLNLSGLMEQSLLLISDEVVKDILEGSLVAAGKQGEAR